MKTFRIGVMIVAAVGVLGANVFAQRMGGPGNLGTAEMAKIFGKNQAFTATADMTVADSQHGGPVEMESNYAFLNGNVRIDMNLASMKGGGMSPQAAAQMKQMGMDQMSTIYRGDKGSTYMVYPGMKSYCEMSPGGQQTNTTEKPPKIETAAQGTETIDGHVCTKNLITITEDDGTKHVMTAWQAKDLNDFPIKTEMHEGTTSINTHFSNIKLSAPDASLFNPPADYKQYSNIQEMMMGNMSRMMPQGMGH